MVVSSIVPVGDVDLPCQDSRIIRVAHTSVSILVRDDLVAGSRV